MAIIAKNLTYTYNPKTPFQLRALDQLDLTVEDGDFCAIVGRTGSGKSTFVQHLNALIRVESGSLIVDGMDLSDKKLDLKALRAKVGMVFQYPEYQLFADTVYNDIAFGPLNMGVDKAKLPEMIDLACKGVGLIPDQVLSKSPFELSGGERRRVALAGVLVMQPQVLVLDEPTAGLDPVGKKEILDIIARLNKERNVTVLMVSHDMDEIYSYCDKVAVFDKGKVVYYSTPERLFDGNTDVKQLGLGYPSMAVVANALRRHGVEVRGRTVEQLTESILQYKQSEGNNV